MSVARVEAAARAIGQSHDPLKLLFGLALLLYGRSFPHLILFTHAFKISGWPMLLSASQKMGVGYASITKGANKAKKHCSQQKNRKKCELSCCGCDLDGCAELWD